VALPLAEEKAEYQAKTNALTSISERRILLLGRHDGAKANLSQPPKVLLPTPFFEAASSPSLYLYRLTIYLKMQIYAESHPFTGFTHPYN
jgi:hypothetical protein